MDTNLIALGIASGVTGTMLFLGIFVGWDWGKWTHVHYKAHKGHKRRGPRGGYVGGSGGSSARRQRKAGGYGGAGGTDYGRMVGG